MGTRGRGQGGPGGGQQSMGGSFTAKRRGKTLSNALIGAVVAFFLSFIAIGPVLGGVAAGYLQGLGTGEGAKVGTLSALVGTIPAIVVVWLLVSVLGVSFFLFNVAEAVGVAGLLSAAIILLAVLAVVVSLVMGAIGGAVGGLIGEQM